VQLGENNLLQHIQDAYYKRLPEGKRATHFRSFIVQLAKTPLITRIEWPSLPNRGGHATQAQKNVSEGAEGGR
jgi:hypothetical protein